MRILQVITGMGKAAGTSLFCGELSNELVANGHSVTVAICTLGRPNQFALEPRIELRTIDGLESVKDWDVVHIHALWHPALQRVAKLATSEGVPVIWSPHGMLTPWAMQNKWLKKKLGWYLYQRKNLAAAALLHATAESEVEDIRRLGLENEVIVAPLGVRLVAEADIHHRGAGNKKTLLFVSRIQRKKGLPNLIEAWSRLPVELRSNWQVRIVGPDQDNHTAELKAQCEARGVSADFEFVGPRYDQELQAEYARADLFVLPTHSENFGSVVIEALAQSVPVICTKGAPWEELEINQCGWWIDIGVEPLVAALEKAMALPDDERRWLGANGLALVRQRYAWGVVADKMSAAYGRIIK